VDAPAIEIDTDLANEDVFENYEDNNKYMDDDYEPSEIE